MAPFLLHESEMAVNLSIKGVPESIAQRLRQRAERNHRSLQGELMAIVEQAAATPPPVASAAGTGRGRKTIEQIALEHRALYPQPFADAPRGVDIVREDRDAR